MLTDEQRRATDEYARQEWVKYLRECDNPMKKAEEILLGIFAVAERGFDNEYEQRAIKAITLACLEVLGERKNLSFVRLREPTWITKGRRLLARK